MVIFAFIGNLARCSCWDRATNARYFDGAVFVRHKSVLKTDIIRKMKIVSEIKCSQACLSENSCVAHTYCRTPSSPDKGTCYLHQNGIPEGEASVLDKKDECIYQQYIGFIVSNFTIEYFSNSFTVYLFEILLHVGRKSSGTILTNHVAMISKTCITRMDIL